jgi:hypothetical protein
MINPSQNPFHQMLLANSISGKTDEINNLMNQCYEKLMNKEFTKEYFATISPHLLECIQPSARHNVEQAIQRFTDNM